MILNSQANQYETRQRVSSKINRRVVAKQRVDKQGVRLDPNGSLKERFAWMRERQREKRQREKRQRESSESALRVWKRRRVKQGPPESNVAPQR